MVRHARVSAVPDRNLERRAGRGNWDTGYKTIYIADTGTAVTNLVLGYHMSKDEGQKASFVEALGRYSRFVTGGCTTVPTLNSTTTPLGTTCPPKGKGWVHTEGANAGGLGDGYYMGGINMLPYSISTATTGSCTFSEVTSISASASWGIPFQQISQGAIKWLLDSRNSSGVIPYILHGPNGSLFPGHYIYQAITYSSESFISNALRFPDSAVAMASQLNSTVDWMIKEQNPDGTWGVLLSGDGERSPRAVSLLQWHNSIFPSSKTTAAIASFVKYLLDPQNSAAFGVKKGILQRRVRWLGVRRSAAAVGHVLAALIELAIPFGGGLHVACDRGVCVWCVCVTVTMVEMRCGERREGVHRRESSVRDGSPIQSPETLLSIVM